MTDQEIRAGVKDAFSSQRADWMDDTDFEELTETLVSVVGGWDTLLEQFRVGERNGHSIEFQLRLFSAVISRA